MQKVIVTLNLNTESLGEPVIIFIGDESEGLAIAKELAPHLREFKYSDYRGHAGAEALPSGSPPKIYESEILSIVVSGYAD
jgi:hypothetical protein